MVLGAAAPAAVYCGMSVYQHEDSLATELGCINAWALSRRYAGLADEQARVRLVTLPAALGVTWLPLTAFLLHLGYGRMAEGDALSSVRVHNVIILDSLRVTPSAGS
jgi:hypothetical protein